MPKTDLAALKELDSEASIQMIDWAYKYLLDRKSVNLKGMRVNARVPFSQIYTFLKGNPQHRIEELDQLDVDESVKKALKAKVFLMYAQNYTKIGLLSTYQNELAKVTEKSNNSMAMRGQPLNYVGMQWKVNVVVSTSYSARVLRPEVHIELFTAENRRIRMTVPVDKFEELRRQVASLLRQAQQIECVNYIN